MAWFTRFTRFGDTHLVYAQEKENSCGIACVMMVVFKINKFIPGRQAVHEETAIYKVYGDASGAAYDGSSYSYANHLASTLNKLKVGNWKAEYIGPAAVSKKIVDTVGTEIFGLGLVGGLGGMAVNALRHKKPIIILVGWNKGGAHFVVVDTVNNALGTLYASVCDPWDGNVHITRFEVGKKFDYVGAPVPLSWDLGGKRHDYSKPKPGASDGWVVYPD